MKLPTLFFSIDHFRVIESGISGSSDGFWLSLGLSFLDLFSAKKMPYREVVLGGVAITKDISCNTALTGK